MVTKLGNLNNQGRMIKIQLALGLENIPNDLSIALPPTARLLANRMAQWRPKKSPDRLPPSGESPLSDCRWAVFF